MHQPNRPACQRQPTCCPKAPLDAVSRGNGPQIDYHGVVGHAPDGVLGAAAEAAVSLCLSESSRELRAASIRHRCQPVLSAPPTGRKREGGGGAAGVGADHGGAGGTIL